MSEFFFDLPEARGRVYNLQNGGYRHEVKHENGVRESWSGEPDWLGLSEEDIKRAIPRKMKYTGV